MTVVNVILVVIVNILILFLLLKLAKPEKKQLLVVALLLVIGGAFVPLAGYLESWMGAWLHNSTSTWYDKEIVDGVTHILFKGTGYLVAYQILFAFGIVALIEELLKCMGCLCLVILIQKITGKALFKKTFDPIFYSCIVALGFGLVEDIVYVVGQDLGSAFVRILSEFSGHVFFAFIFGFFLHKQRLIQEKNMISSEIATKCGISDVYQKKSWYFVLLGLLVAIFVHGLYDFFMLTSSALPKVGMFIFLGISYAIIIVYSVFFWILIMKSAKKNQEYSMAAANACEELYPNASLEEDNAKEES